MQARQLGAAIAAMWMGNAAAVHAPDVEVPYVTGGALLEVPDSARDSDNGVGVQFQFGLPLGPYGYPGFAAEATLHYLGRDRDAIPAQGGLFGSPGVPGGSDAQSGLVFDLVYDFGDVGSAYAVRPFVLAGVGAVQNDVANDTHVHLAGNVGAGVLLPLRWLDLGLRLEARALLQADDESTADDALLDYRFGAALQVPLIWPQASTAVARPTQECEVAIVDPVTGRAECGVDSDRDGVLDGQDQCPMTAPGVLVDTRGCAIAQTTAPSVAAAPRSGDEDGDGVGDGADRCPGTRIGLRVDAGGCFVSQTLNFGVAMFRGDTAVLTPEARQQLLTLAGTLKVQADASVLLSGVVSGSGDAAYRLQIAQQRVESVRQTLIARGVKEARIRVDGDASGAAAQGAELRLVIG